MSLFLSRFLRATILSIVLAILGALLLLTWPGLVRAQDAPAADCNSGPNVACPGLDDPALQYIGSVTALPDGVVILLTDDGLVKARECGGPAAIAMMAKTIYDVIPTSQKSDFQLDWSSQTLFDEIYGHAFLNRLSGGLGAFGNIHERSNPINIVFADYGGPGEMTTEARAEQATFAALGAVHRATC
ncbi:MAG: hypothetical protein E6R14_08250 [Thermomicrobiales bacterium]|nr:MAG: hypothetical protein E6R14_08250 [Thermomicrobiales bacterium]